MLKIIKECNIEKNIINVNIIFYKMSESFFYEAFSCK